MSIDTLADTAVRADTINVVAQLRNAVCATPAALLVSATINGKTVRIRFPLDRRDARSTRLYETLLEKQTGIAALFQDGQATDPNTILLYDVRLCGHWETHDLFVADRWSFCTLYGWVLETNIA